MTASEFLKWCEVFGLLPVKTPIPAAGSMFNFQSTELTSLYSYTITSTSGWVDTALSVTITPTSASDKVLITGVAYMSSSVAGPIGFRLTRDGTPIGVGTSPTSAEKGTAVGTPGGNTGLVPVPFRFTDSPASTSAVTYTLQTYIVTVNPVTVWLNQEGSDPGSSDAYFEVISTIDACEIAA